MTGQTKGILIAALVSLMLWGIFAFGVYLCWNTYQAWDQRQVQKRVSLIIQRSDETARMVTYLRGQRRYIHTYQRDQVIVQFQAARQDENIEIAANSLIDTVRIVISTHEDTIKAQWRPKPIWKSYTDKIKVQRAHGYLIKTKNGWRSSR